MEVMQPPIIRIGRRCFRRNPLDPKYQTGEDTSDREREDYHSAAALGEDMYCDEVCDAFTNIEETPSGFQTRLDIPSAYFKFLIGRKGETKRRLETETKTQIRIPRQGTEGPVFIVGHDKKGVFSAKNRVDILVESARQKQPFTHFLSFPISGAHVKDKFQEFKDDVLRFCDGDRGVESSLFQNPLKLHMTIGTLALLSDGEIETAATLLAQCQQDLVEPILKGSPLVAQVRGLEYMNDDPSAVDVLYAQVHVHDGSDRLQAIADRLVDKFTSAGLMQRDFDRVKLHITAMNTLFRSDPGGASRDVHTDGQHREPTNGRQVRDGRKERQSFDAAKILKVCAPCYV